MNHTNIERVTEVIRKYPSTMLAAAALVGMSAKVILLSMSNKLRAKHFKIMYKITGDRLYLIKYLQTTMSNNWLKMHGYPMARRARR